MIKLFDFSLSTMVLPYFGYLDSALCFM